MFVSDFIQLKSNGSTKVNKAIRKDTVLQIDDSGTTRSITHLISDSLGTAVSEVDNSFEEIMTMLE